MENQVQPSKNEGKLEKEESSFIEVLKGAISGFNERSKEIIFARYGISGEDPKTLEEIGGKYEITRERVRQIIQESLKKARAKKDQPVVQEARQKLAFTISEKNGIINKEELVKLLGNGSHNEAAAVDFLLDCFDDFVSIEIKDELKKSYTLKNFNIDEWRKLKNSAKLVLEKEKKPLTDNELLRKVSSQSGAEADKKLFNYLAVSEEIKRNCFDKWGITAWEEVSPKNTREKAYLVLKDAEEPLHFTKIAELIDKNKLSKKKTHFQTVHNELIKDNRFVLVGRGVYALSEWGYKRGTVKDILEEILKKNAGPMSREEVIDQVMKMRQVKKSTVMINLNNFFVKTNNNEYTLGK
jgi:DNA-directed RNA polymerase delta subunit